MGSMLRHGTALYSETCFLNVAIYPQWQLGETDCIENVGRLPSEVYQNVSLAWVSLTRCTPVRPDLPSQPQHSAIKLLSSSYIRYKHDWVFAQCHWQCTRQIYRRKEIITCNFTSTCQNVCLVDFSIAFKPRWLFFGDYLEVIILEMRY